MYVTCVTYVKNDVRDLVVLENDNRCHSTHRQSRDVTTVVCFASGLVNDRTEHHLLDRRSIIPMFVPVKFNLAIDLLAKQPPPGKPQDKAAAAKFEAHMTALKKFAEQFPSAEAKGHSGTFLHDTVQVFTPGHVGLLEIAC